MAPSMVHFVLKVVILWMIEILHGLLYRSPWNYGAQYTIYYLGAPGT